MEKSFKSLLRDDNYTPTKWLKEQQEAPGTRVSRIEIGSMYLFTYDPKTADKLPYYDTSPLVMPFAATKGGFKGLNFHYIPPLMRAALFDEIMNINGKKNITSQTRLALSYNVLKQAANSKYFLPCVKQYLSDHVRSQFILINPNLWEKVLMMPLANFNKANISTVYANARKF